MKSGVPQGSVLGPLLFLIYINDIDDSVCNNLLKFADDTKVFSVVRNDKDINKLQNDLVNLGKWSLNGHKIGLCCLTLINAKLCTLDKISTRRITK